jgi:hypothetical protein
MYYSGNGNGATSIRLISARSLSHRHLTKAQRALIGAAILEGAIRPQDLPRRIVAQLVDCSVTYLAAAQRLAPQQREAVDRGHRPLISPPSTHRLPKPRIPPTDEQLVQLARAVGAERLFRAIEAVI